MNFWKGWRNLQRLVLEGGISDLVLSAVGGWEILLLIITGAVFVFSAGLLFEKMKEYKTLRRIAGMIALFGFGVLCLDMFAKFRGQMELTKEPEMRFTPLREPRKVTPEDREELEKAVKEATEDKKSGAK